MDNNDSNPTLDSVDSEEVKSDHWTIQIKKPSLPKLHAPSPKMIALATASAAGGALVGWASKCANSGSDDINIDDVTMIELTPEEVDQIKDGDPVIFSTDSTDE